MNASGKSRSRAFGRTVRRQQINFDDVQNDKQKLISPYHQSKLEVV